MNKKGFLTAAEITGTNQTIKKKRNCLFNKKNKICLIMALFSLSRYSRKTNSNRLL